MNSDMDIAAAAAQLQAFPFSLAQQENIKTLLRDLVADSALEDIDSRLASLLAAIYRADQGVDPSAGLSEDDSQSSVLMPRLYRMLDRLLRHLNLLSGEERDTWWFRNQLGEAPSFAHAQVILDELEAFLVEADAEIARDRDAELRTLSYSQRQCEELIDHAAYASKQLKGVVEHLPESGLADVLTDQEAELLRLLQKDLDRAEDRLRLVERKLNELHSGVRSRVDIGFKDIVTGVYKEEGFSVRCAELHARWQRAGSPLAVVVTSVEAASDTPISPLSRDEFMRLCAKELEARIRVSDVLARTAESEFVLLLPDTSIDGANSFTSRMVIALETAGFNQYGEAIRLSVAAGLTAVKTGDDTHSFVERARQACQAARQKGLSTLIE